VCGSNVDVDAYHRWGRRSARGSCAQDAVETRVARS
jgi:hypothetical protein